MRLKSLRLQNFRSFFDSTIQFPETGLTLIQGTDSSTGESSGTGKSSIFLGLAYALDILPPAFSAKSLQNWSSEEALQVTLTLTHNDREITLYRGRKTLVDFGDRQVSGAKSYPEALKEIFGVSPEVLAALTFRPQNTNGFFLGMTPSEKIEFLSKVLGLESIENAVEASQAQAKALTATLATLDSEAQRARSRLEIASSEILPTPEDPDLLKPVFVEKSQLYQQAVEKRSKAENKLLATQVSLRTERASEIKVANESLERTKKFLGTLTTNQAAQAKVQREKEQAARQNLQKLISTIQRLDSQKPLLLKAKENLQRLTAGSCPTCEREWDKTEALREKTKQQIASYEQEEQGRAIYESQKQEIQATLSVSSEIPQDPRIAELRLLESKLEKDLVRLESVNTHPEILTLQTQVSDLKAEESTCKSEMKDVEYRLDKATASQNSFQFMLDNKNKRVATAKEEVEALLLKAAAVEMQCRAERDFALMLGREGFLGLIVDEVLHEISTEANTRFGKLANVNRVSVSFSTENEKGKRQIQTWVDVRGFRTKFESGLSGGQQTSLEQVIDLAVGSVISRRTGGKIPGWLCLDEVFNGQGRVTKEAVFEVLQEFACDRLILVVDHSLEFKEAFAQSIDVVFENGQSKVG